ncbi:MAG: SDR family oxidoreductase [Gemmataceae bacterium]
MRPSPIPLPLLITGINGVAGFNAFRYFEGRYPAQVVGIRPWKFGQPAMPGVHDLAIEDCAKVRELFEHYRFQAVLSCAGNCALKSCELDPIMAWRLNVASVVAVLESVRGFGSRLVHLSSDLVYSGSGQGNYSETDPIDPVTVYGKTMGEAEQLIAESYPETAILRISLPMGPSPNRHAGAIDWIDSRFRNGRPATLYFDEVRSCTYCGDLNPVFERFLAGDEAGLYHLGGPRAITLYQIAQVINRVGGYDPNLLRGCPRIMAGPMPPRAGNVSMCSDKLVSLLGRMPFNVWPSGEELFPTNRQWHFARDPNNPGSFQEIINRLYYVARPPATDVA